MTYVKNLAANDVQQLPIVNIQYQAMMWKCVLIYRTGIRNLAIVRNAIANLEQNSVRLRIFQWYANEIQWELSKMNDPRQLSYMLSLLDDDSPSVHEAVHAALSAWGPSLREDLRRLSLPEQALAEERLAPIIRENDRAWLRQLWLSPIDSKDNAFDLEQYLGQLSEFLDERSESGILTKRLDSLARSFLQTAGPHDSESLACHLFGPYGIHGSPAERYYRLENCNVRQVIDEKEGIPISLTTVYILVAKRIGYCVRGCNFPGHFLAIADLRERKVIVDCFNGGRILGFQDSKELDEALPESIQEISSMECPEHVLLQRYLRNLTNSYHRLGDVANERFFDQLLIDFAGRIPSV